MSDAKHTPGPWETFNRQGLNEIGVRREGFDGGTVCDVYDHLNLVEAEANARLIAAAPDLLNALSSLVSHMESIGSLITREEEPFIEAAHAAIAKAEGRTS